MKEANLKDYAKTYEEFDWSKETATLSGLPDGKGLNIAYEAVDRHALGPLKDVLAIRLVRKDHSYEDLTYGDLKKRTAQFANVLRRLGIAEGEKVFSLLGRVPELYVTALGSLKFKAVYCPLFSVFGPEPIFQRLSKGEGAVLVTNTQFYIKKVRDLLDRLPTLKYILLIDVAEDLDDKALSFSKLMKKVSDEFTIPPTQEEDPALLHFTSGTTGMPKGAIHVHKAVFTHYITGKYVLDFQPGDVFWCTADPGWVTGTSYGIISPLVNGVTSIVDEEEFDAMRWYGILEKEKVNIWYTAPTAIRRLMRMNLVPKEKFDLSALRLVLSVGEPLHAEAVVWGESAYGVPILDNWWQTETGGIMIANFPSLKVKPGSMGKPLPGVEVGIADVEGEELVLLTNPEAQGHLVLKKDFPSIFRGYLHEEERYQKCFMGDWYLSGDLAKKDAEGYFWFVGRADDIIKTSGHMVGPFEVESNLMRHPAVAEAAVIGKPEPSIGELVKAFVVLKEGHAANEDLELELIGYARKVMGPAVAPKEIQFVESLPKTKSGKILRRLLKARELGLPEGDLSTLEKN
ncbi:acetate--CoA ligase [Cecembia lonarensis]|uniref:acetate--CoA ligase n=1 Tax=Cecembia lonarensis (strain CCUG 58316 / KCTC 22772 / LW9) TaxID=1225176 RepID=K1L0X1_CECL9|nr:acetate--CoA ligase [Cecembia lonarensis]EKB48426.1 Acetyl-coenzyme A synthetase [Cecembia lonarensis LW9]